MRQRIAHSLTAALVAVAVLAVPGAAHAMTFRRGPSGGNVVIGPNETIDDDLYVFGNTVEVRGTVRGTVFAVGNSVSVEGSVSGDVWAAGNSVRVGGEVGRSVHAAGDEVSIGGRTRGDVTAAGNTVVLSPGLAGGRDAALAGNIVSVAGTVDRNLFAGASDLVISGSVGGDVNAGVERLTLADGASVRGNLRYTSDNAAGIAKGATVGGRVTRTRPRQEREPSAATRVIGAFVAWIRRLIGLLLFGLIVALVFPLFTRRAADGIARRPLPALGLGLAVLFGVPLAAAFALIVGVITGGWWISLMALSLYVIAIAVATIVSAVFLGRWLLGMAGDPDPHVLLALLVGLLVLTLAESVPILGLLVRFAEVVFGLGATALALSRPLAQPAAAAPAFEQPRTT